MKDSIENNVQKYDVAKSNIDKWLLFYYTACDITLHREFDRSFGWQGFNFYIIEYEYKGEKRKKAIISGETSRRKIVSIKVCKWFPKLIYMR